MEQTVWCQPWSSPSCCCWPWSRSDSPRTPKRVPMLLVLRGGGKEGHFLRLSPSQPGFPAAGTVVTGRSLLGLNFSRLVACVGSGPGGTDLSPCWGRLEAGTCAEAETVLGEAGSLSAGVMRSEGSKGRSWDYQALLRSAPRLGAPLSTGGLGPKIVPGP